MPIAESTEVLKLSAEFREQLRTFHIAGRGLEEMMPAAAMRPAVLDRLAVAPPQTPYTPESLIRLYVTQLARSRGEARNRLAGEIKKASERLRELLVIDRSYSPEAHSPQTIAASLGREADAFFDPGALAAAFRSPANGTGRIDPERRSRIESTLQILMGAVNEIGQEPEFYLLHAPGIHLDIADSGVRCLERADSFLAALQLCDELLERLTAVLRALRAARLECECAFDASIHPQQLDRFDWQSATEDEVAALPCVIVFETAERLAQMSLASFGRLLRSGRPVEVLVASAGFYAEDFTGFAPDLGYISMAHREAFVLQSSVARSEHLCEGFAEIARSLRPAVAIVSVPDPRQDPAAAWTEIALLAASRAVPLYRYDPDRGDTWAQRFALCADESPAQDLSVADPAAASARFLRHFRIIPEAEYDAEQMPLNDYLRDYCRDAPLAIPYIWILDAQGNRRRAALTRELVNVARDRARAWRVFEELAGIRNAYVESAMQQMTRENDGRAKQEGAAAAVQRVIAMLTGPRPAVVLQPAPAPQSTAAASAAPPFEETAVSAGAAETAYIDSFLCTSCNDCFKINPRMFAYDSNKQAYIADVHAGTYAELVKAAAGCPAKCIHPGSPY